MTEDMADGYSYKKRHGRILKLHQKIWLMSIATKRDVAVSFSYKTWLAS
jgi:hypothetical protein